jgi:hypothetical protein
MQTTQRLLIEIRVGVAFVASQNPWNIFVCEEEQEEESGILCWSHPVLWVYLAVVVVVVVFVVVVVVVVAVVVVVIVFDAPGSRSVLPPVKGHVHIQVDIFLYLFYCVFLF